MTAPTLTIPACCICDPAACLADDTGEHCEIRSCGSCLHGCPAPDGQCCDADAPADPPAPPPAASTVELTLDGAGWLAPDIPNAMRWTPAPAGPPA